MKRQQLWVLSGMLCLSVLLACTQATPSPKPPATTTPAKSTPAPTTTTTASAKPASPSAPAGLSFAGKTITVAVPYTPGGGADIMGRLYAMYLPRYLPGNPTLVVRNMPGGEGTIGAHFAYGSKPDGLTLMVSGSSLAMADLLDKPSLKIKSLTELTAITAAPASSEIYYFQPNLFDKPEDIMKAKGIVYGGTTGGGSMTIFVIVKEFLGIPTEKVVGAYGGGSDARRAFFAGEINAGGETSISWDALRPFYEKGQFKILLQSGILDESGNVVRHPALPPDTLTAKELYEKIYGKPPSGIAWEALLSMIGAVDSIGRILLLPPGASPDLVKTYWAAAEKMVKDPQFVKAAEPQVGAGAKWTAGEPMDKLFKKIFVLRPEVSAWLKDTLRKYGQVVD